MKGPVPKLDFLVFGTNINGILNEVFLLLEQKPEVVVSVWLSVRVYMAPLPLNDLRIRQQLQFLVIFL